VYRLKITLRDTNPPIWRRIELFDCTLGELNHIVQEAMGWMNSHLHTFEVGGVEYGEANPEWDVEEEERIRLSTVIDSGAKKFRFTYDMGDNWEHILQIEKPVAVAEGASYPRCIAGARNCPPEDCGGVWGYVDLIEALADPNHPEHEELLDWIGGEFDPEAFDLDEINARLAGLGRGKKR
jgi:hypothetical protein